MTWSLNFSGKPIPEAREVVADASTVPQGIRDFIDQAFDAFPNDAAVTVAASGHTPDKGPVTAAVEVKQETA